MGCLKKRGTGRKRTNRVRKSPSPSLRNHPNLQRVLSLRARRCPSLRVRRYPSLRVLRCPSLRVRRCPSLRVLRCPSLEGDYVLRSTKYITEWTDEHMTTHQFVSIGFVMFIVMSVSILSKKKGNFRQRCT